MNSRGVNQRRSKEINRGLVLKMISTGRTVTRHDLVEETSLTRMAISNIVGELISAGLVEEGTIKKTESVGRNPVVLAIAPGAPRVIGILITRNEVRAVLSDLSLHLLDEMCAPLGEETAETLLKKVCGFISAFLAAESRVCGIGVASIGQWDAENGKLLRAVHFWNIQELPLRDILEERFRLPVFVNNDMNAATLAEKLFGHGRRFSNFLYLGISNGIGGGIVTDDRLYNEDDGLAGEIGHMGVDPGGPVCECGNRGCLEMYASVPVIGRRLREATGRDLSFRDFCKEEITPPADAVFRDVFSKMAYALNSAINILNSEAVIIGHEGALIPEPYFSFLRDELSRTQGFAGHRVEVLRTAFEDRTALYGSVCCVLKQIFDGKLLL